MFLSNICKSDDVFILLIIPFLSLPLTSILHSFVFYNVWRGSSRDFKFKKLFAVYRFNIKDNWSYAVGAASNRLAFLAIPWGVSCPLGDSADISVYIDPCPRAKTFRHFCAAFKEKSISYFQQRTGSGFFSVRQVFFCKISVKFFS